MRVVHLSCHRDPRRRDAEAMLDAWPTLTDVAAAAAAAGAEVHVVQAGWRDAAVVRGGIRVHVVAEPGGRVLPRRASAALPLRLLRRVRALRPDVVHLHGLGFPVQARLAASAGAPLLVQDHGLRAPPPSRIRLYRWGLARASAFAFTAAAQAEPFRAAGVLNGHPVIEVLESSTRFTPGDRTEARRTTGIHGDPAVLWIGRLTEEKDPMTALEGFARAADRLADAHLWMAYGDAPLLAAVRARIEADPRLRGRAHLLGRLPHARVQAACRAADLFLSASRREGSGYAVLEAMACGTPPILADVPAPRRITRDGTVGALFPAGDADALAARLVDLGTRPREAERARVRGHFAAHLSFGAVGRELRDAYAAVAEARR